MRKLAAFVFSVAMVCGCALAARAFQNGDGRTPTRSTGSTGSTGSTSSTGAGGAGRSGRGNRPTNTVVRPMPTPLPSARLTVRVLNPQGSAVELDGKDLGATDAAGYMQLPAVYAGRHVVVVRKMGYYEYRGAVELAGGPNGTLEVTLQPRPGHLTVTPNLPGASVSIEGAGSFNESANNVELAPGTYRVRVTKLGYAALEQEVTIGPGLSNNLTLTLTRLPANQLASLAESEYEAGRYERAVALGEMALADMPSHPHLTMLLGLSHFRLNNLSVSLDYLRQALMLGQTININVKHFHKLKKGEGFCQGQLVLRRGTLEFRSGDNPSESFAVNFSKIIGARPDPDKDWRVSMQVWLPDPKKKNKKEKGFDYSFHPAQAYLRNKDPRKPNSPTLAACSDCQPMAQFIYQLIEQASR